MVKLAGSVAGNATGVPAPYGLLSQAVLVIEDDSPHWENGFNYDTFGCAGTTSVHSICISASAPTVSASGEQSRKYRPFTVKTEFTCSTMSRTPAELKELAKNELDLVLQKAIEKEFLTGTLAELEATEVVDPEELANRYLSDDEAISLSGSALKPRLGLALLEGALGSIGNGAQGVIHMPRSAAEALDLEGDGAVLRTKLDTPVVAGTGYTENATDTTVTLYGTGPITVRLGPVVVTPTEDSQAVNRKNNSATYYAERSVAVTWDSCVHFSVPINLTLDY